MANNSKTAIGYKSSAAVTVTERPNRLVAQLIKSNKTRGRQAIDNWTKANNQAGNALNPKRLLLYNLYDELMLDGEVFSEWETRRKLRLIACDFDLFDINNKPVEEATELLNSLWFTELMSLAFDSKLWGHSLIEVKTITSEGLIDSIELVRRRHVIPEFGIFTTKVGDEKGVFYREDPAIMQWVFEVGNIEDLGLLNICAPYVLFMRFAMSAWSEFCELFAMPLRVGKTQSKDTTSLNRMNDMLLDMATASYAVIDKDETIEFIETNKSDGSVYKGLMELCAAKLSKILNGAVIGEASNGGSNAKEKVGQDIQNLVTSADMKWFEGWMKSTGIPKLASFGYPVDGLKFKFKRPKDLSGPLEIVKTLSEAGYKPTREWVQDEIGVPLDEAIVVDPILPKNVKAQTNFFD